MLDTYPSQIQKLNLKFNLPCWYFHWLSHRPFVSWNNNLKLMPSLSLLYCYRRLGYYLNSNTFIPTFQVNLRLGFTLSHSFSNQTHLLYIAVSTVLTYFCPILPGLSISSISSKLQTPFYTHFCRINLKRLRSIWHIEPYCFLLRQIHQFG